MKRKLKKIESAKSLKVLATKSLSVLRGGDGIRDGILLQSPPPPVEGEEEK